MPQRYGRTGKILVLNAADWTCSTIEPDRDTAAQFIGGRGLAGSFLRPHAHLSPDSPDMPLIFMTGPLTATPSPSSGGICVMSKSPLTGTVFPLSAGGTFGTELKKAGWDGIILTGRSASPCGIVISDSSVVFEECRFSASMTIGQRTSGFGSGAWAVTGPAAENGVLFASISFSEEKTPGRGGLGLVMEHKNVRFIHVRGSGSEPLYDSGRLSAACDDILRLVSASPVLAGEQGFSRYGTGALIDLVNSRRMLPCNNFRETFLPHASEMNAYTYDRTYSPLQAGCPGCPVQCSRRLPDGRLLPEYNAMAHLSALVGNGSTRRVIEAAGLCAETGMDPVSAASAIACFIEINRVPPGETDIVRLLENTAFSRDEGELLKLGAGRCAQLSGMPELSMSVKGLELPAFDPRGAYGTALSYAVSTRGGCYLDACAISHEILRKPVATDRFTFNGKPRMIKLAEDMHSAADSLAVCGSILYAASLEEYAKVLHAVTGNETTGHDLMLAGERINYNERIMNHLSGFTSADDDLPARFFTQPGTSGDGINIPALDRDEFLDARRRYYRVRGLSPEGIPLEKKMHGAWT